MWIVSNQLKGVLKFPALGLEVAPEGEADLDTLGREKETNRFAMPCCFKGARIP